MKPEHSVGIIYCFFFLGLIISGWIDAKKHTDTTRFWLVFYGGGCIALFLSRLLWHSLN